METQKTDLLTEVANYYSNKIVEYGQTPQGVDWNGEESQTLRFEQLSKVVVGSAANFSVNDLGCGYGALFDYLKSRYTLSAYLGIDVSKDMIRSAQSNHQEESETRFIVAAKPDSIADYGMASGIFNVRLERNDNEWFEYLQATLDILNDTSQYGFAFNCLTAYSDEDKKRDYLYYADPCKLFDLCKRRYSRQIALLHDYGLYEFTILVRKA
tara:strand:- start:609 stop:1244 length:636 start_codon:yes stop_codon:yes gene_type:complete